MRYALFGWCKALKASVVSVMLAGVLLALMLSTGCGYHVGAHSDLLPATIHTIAVPAFSNLTNRYKLSDRLPSAITREFLSRTRYKVVPKEEDADAVLRGAVINYQSFPIVSDQNTGRATVVQIVVTMQVTLLDRKTGKVIYSRPSFELRNRYEISLDPNAYFEESDTALDRLSTDVARMTVSAVLEAF